MTDQTTTSTRLTWTFASADRPLLTETVPHAPKMPLRPFRAYHLAITRNDADEITQIHAAGIVQHDGKDSPTYTSETWHAPPFPLELWSYFDRPVSFPEPKEQQQ